MRDLVDAGYSLMPGAPPLGEGATALVYAVYGPSGDGPYALKITRHNVSRAVAQRMEREIDLMRHFASHPRLLGLVDVGLWYGAVGIVMPLMSGGSVATRWQEFSGHPSMVWQLVDQTLEGLAALHAAHVVHRDIKPQNLLLDHAGALRIADLGIARVYGSNLTTDASPLGTLAYIAPEQALNPSGVGPDADLFALAVLVHELLVGAHPFPPMLDATASNLLMADRAALQAFFAPTWIRALRASPYAVFEPFFQRALSLDPLERFASAAQFAEAFFPLLAGFAGTGPATEVPPEREPEHQDRRWYLPMTMETGSPGSRHHALLRLWWSIPEVVPLFLHGDCLLDEDVAGGSARAFRMQGASGRPAVVQGDRMRLSPDVALEGVWRSPLVLGRDTPAHVVIQHPSISRLHAMLLLTPTTLLIHDLNSTNGVYVDAGEGHCVRVEQRHELNLEVLSGVRLWLGADAGIGIAFELVGASSLRSTG